MSALLLIPNSGTLAMVCDAPDVFLKRGQLWGLTNLWSRVQRGKRFCCSCAITDYWLITGNTSHLQKADLTPPILTKGVQSVLWIEELRNDAIPFLNQNFPPANWDEHIPRRRGVAYFFREHCIDDFHIGQPPPHGHGFPAFHFFVGSYENCNFIICAARLETENSQATIPRPRIPPEVEHLFAGIREAKPPELFGHRAKDLGRVLLIDNQFRLRRSNAKFDSNRIQCVNVEGGFNPRAARQPLSHEIWESIIHQVEVNGGLNQFLHLPV